MLDEMGFRPNVGIILINQNSQVFWGKRIRSSGWQFPQGGVDAGESVERTMYRELHEELGLHPHHIEILGRTRDWIRYTVPRHMLRNDARGRYQGQKQIWFLLRMRGEDHEIDLRAAGIPEFDDWRWTNYWVDLKDVIAFKREAYRLALTELAQALKHSQISHSLEVFGPPPAYLLSPTGDETA